jgi:carboxynorspermidine decarboxylase
MKFGELKTPAYIVDEAAIRKNLEILHEVQEETGCKILLAQKAFSMFRIYPMIAEYLAGTTASGIYEAKLAAEEFHTEKETRENHVFEPAYKTDEMQELCGICSHIYFNSIAQLELHRPVWDPYEKAGRLKVALRINPEHSTQEGHAIYDPCAPGSRLGIRRERFPERLPTGVSGLHFHTLCEQGVEPLIETFRAVEERFGDYLSKISWINLGGGHHITVDGYDVVRLKEFLSSIRDRYGFEIYLEPGEAIAIHAGTLITTVLDVVDTEDMPTLILDASAACHMPDVLEMPYTPPLFGAVPYQEQKTSDADGEDEDLKPVRLAARTCLAGDVIGTYRMREVPKVGDILTFGDMAIYSMVKNNTFNGMALPDIVLKHEGKAEDTGEAEYELVRRFGYSDFKNRLS